MSKEKNSNKSYSDLRASYKKGVLLELDLPDSPLDLFTIWMSEALESSELEPNAMVLGTIDIKGIPSSRVVLLKEILEGSFVFYTNYKSDKAKDIDVNPNVSLNFFWKSLEQQIRIIGSAAKTSRETTKTYFSKRPRGSKIGAWTSPQSSIIPDRSYLDDLEEEHKKKFGNENEIPTPEHWGGYMVTPFVIEFWQGRESRLHDRIRYKLNVTGWIRERLAP